MCIRDSIYDAKCSMAVPEGIAEAGVRPVMARAGHTFSKRAFLEENALFAGEISGHFFFRELGYDEDVYKRQYSTWALRPSTMKMTVSMFSEIAR